MSNIKSIESFQKVSTTMACIRCNIPFSSYSDRLYKLNLKSLEYCRLEYDLILPYRICFCLIDIDFNEFFARVETISFLRRHTVQ